MFDQVGQGKAFKAVKGAFKYISWFQEEKFLQRERDDDQALSFYSN